jgi:LmbE family N-acetylglucosaminyl deacetylase
MIRCRPATQGPLTLLFLGAHSDDIEIGCGGTVLTLLSKHPGSTVHWVVFSATGVRQQEAQSSAAAFLTDAAERHIHLRTFRDGFLPYDGVAVKEYFEGLKELVQPDIVFTHRLDDRHQDHRIVAELTWNTFRNHLILEYEIPKYEGDLGHPNVFVEMTASVARKKIALLMDHFGTQRSKRWFREDVFEGLARVRGVEAGLDDGRAEGFYLRKQLW